jgi:hypothetical protein
MELLITFKELTPLYFPASILNRELIRLTGWGRPKAGAANRLNSRTGILSAMVPGLLETAAVGPA